jgi:hypothetical protein
MFVSLWLAAPGESVSVLAAQIMEALPFSSASLSLATSRAHRTSIRPGRLVPFPDKDSTSPVSHPQLDKPERGHTMPFILLSDDELIARLLIHTWTLTTGKTLRGDVPPHELTEEELIEFWSDDHFDQNKTPDQPTVGTANDHSGAPDPRPHD